MAGETVPSELPDKWAMSIRQPLGVAGIITPWNFPMAIPSWKIIPALVCGNTVVFKPATLTPLSALNFVKILEEAGVPPGVVNLVTGGGGDVGNALLVSDAVRIVSFTGSTDVGRTVAQQSAPSFKKVHLEMGGKSKPVEFVVVGDGGNVTGSATFSQSDWGIKPYSALFGALKVNDDVTVEVEGSLS